MMKIMQMQNHSSQQNALVFIMIRFTHSCGYSERARHNSQNLELSLAFLLAARQPSREQPGQSDQLPGLVWLRLALAADAELLLNWFSLVSPPPSTLLAFSLALSDSACPTVLLRVVHGGLAL